MTQRTIGVDGRPRLRRRWVVGLYVSLAVCSAAFMSARGFAESIGERSAFLGQQLGAFEAFAGRSTEVMLNGQQLSVHSSTVSQPVGEVLRAFVSVCQADSAGAASEFAERIGAERDRDLPAIERMLVMRDQRGEQEGTSLCFAGLGHGGMFALLARIERFAEQLDVSELGALRYLYVRKVATGTHVLFITAPGRLALADMLPTEDGDAVGRDPVPGARPRESVRFLSARLLGADNGITAYRSTRPAAEVLADYEAQLRATGFELLELPQLDAAERSAAFGAGVDLRVLVRGSQTLIATAIPNDAGSALSVVQM